MFDTFQYLAFIGNIGTPELIVVFVVVLLLFGPKKLPELARGLGKSIKEFKKATSEIENEIKSAMDTETSSSKKPPEITRSENE